jgi:GNAT superfamily N-acetyltransferase
VTIRVVDVKPIPGLEHEPYAEVWLHTVDDDAWREASRLAQELGKTGLEVWTTSPEVAAWLGYDEVRRYVISELTVADAAQEPPAIPLTTRAERPDLVPAMYELALQAYPDQPGRAASRIKDYEGWRGWSIDPHPAEACFFALDGERLVAYGFLEEGEEHWTHGFMAVDREHRGKGLAGAIKRAQIAWARAHGVERLRTATETRLTSMRSLNDRLGYHPLYEEIVLRGPIVSAG